MLCFARGTAGASPRPFRSPKSAVPIVNPWRTSVSWCLWSKILKIGGFKQPSNLTLSTNILNWTTYDSTDYDESIPTKRCLRQSFWAEKMNFAAESASSNAQFAAQLANLHIFERNLEYMTHIPNRILTLSNHQNGKFTDVIIYHHICNRNQASQGWLFDVFSRKLDPSRLKHAKHLCL